VNETVVSSTKLLANLTAGLQHVMQAAVRNRRGVKSRGRLHQIHQLPAVLTQVKNLVFGTSNSVHNPGILNVDLNTYIAGWRLAGEDQI
jgi:hypothetical protein